MLKLYLWFKWFLSFYDFFCSFFLWFSSVFYWACKIIPAIKHFSRKMVLFTALCRLLNLPTILSGYRDPVWYLCECSDSQSLWRWICRTWFTYLSIYLSCLYFHLTPALNLLFAHLRLRKSLHVYYVLYSFIFFFMLSCTLWLNVILYNP